MKNIVVSMQNSLLAESIVKALKETGNFRPENILPGGINNIASVCKELDADVLIMEVGRSAAFSLKSRLQITELLKRIKPSCKNALICDENAYPDIAAGIKAAKQDGFIDAFFYASVTVSYLMAMLDAM